MLKLNQVAKITGKIKFIQKLSKEGSQAIKGNYFKSQGIRWTKRPLVGHFYKTLNKIRKITEVIPLMHKL